MLYFTYSAEFPVLFVEDGKEVREGGRKEGRMRGGVGMEKGKFWFSANNLIYHMKSKNYSLSF